MDIRILEGEDRKQFNPLWAQAFSRGERSTDWIEDESSIDFYGLYDAQGLQACLIVNHYETYLGAKSVVKMGGIGGVVSLPASRGKGYAGALLKFALVKMRENG